jgi:hypothetical protein
MMRLLGKNWDAGRQNFLRKIFCINTTFFLIWYSKKHSGKNYLEHFHFIIKGKNLMKLISHNIKKIQLAKKKKNDLRFRDSVSSSPSWGQRYKTFFFFVTDA